MYGKEARVSTIGLYLSLESLKRDELDRCDDAIGCTSLPVILIHGHTHDSSSDTTENILFLNLVLNLIIKHYQLSSNVHLTLFRLGGSTYLNIGCFKQR